MASRFAKYINPVLEALNALGGSARREEVYDWTAVQLQISEEERSIQNKSGVSRFENDVAWARFYLVKAGFIDSSRHGVWSLTEKGRAAGVLTDYQISDLVRSVRVSRPRGQAPGSGSKPRTKRPIEIDEEEEIPDEVGAADGRVGGYRERALETMRDLPASGFERLCQRILRESGFQQVKVTGRSGDGGIDGIGVLQVNPFVSFKVLFQSKRYQGTVSASQVRDFRGAMMGRADKGLIITTGSFSTDARAEAVRDGVPPIELVDGQGLVALLEQLEIGLRPVKTYEVDDRFFEEFLK